MSKLFWIEKRWQWYPQEHFFDHALTALNNAVVGIASACAGGGTSGGSVGCNVIAFSYEFSSFENRSEIVCVLLAGRVSFCGSLL